MTDRPLTSQQQRVLDALNEFQQAHGFPPTLRELGEAVGLANVNAVRGHVAALERKGFLAREADKARSIRLVHEPSAFSRFKRMLHEVVGTDAGVFHRVVYGLAWATRGRAELPPAVRAPLAKAFEREALEHGWTVLESRVQADHVMVIVETWPNHSAELAVRRFQFAGRAAWKKSDPSESGGAWGRGYVATTDLPVLDELVERMLKEQPSEGGRKP